MLALALNSPIEPVLTHAHLSNDDERREERSNRWGAREWDSFESCP